MVIRIIAPYGVGDWATGSEHDVDERRAQRLILTGYAVEVKPKPAKKAKE